MRSNGILSLSPSFFAPDSICESDIAALCRALVEVHALPGRSQSHLCPDCPRDLHGRHLSMLRRRRTASQVIRSRKARCDQTSTSPYPASVKSRVFPVISTAPPAVAVARYTSSSGSRRSIGLEHGGRLHPFQEPIPYPWSDPVSILQGDGRIGRFGVEGALAPCGCANAATGQPSPSEAMTRRRDCDVKWPRR